MNPLISLIVPVYNTESFLPGCLDSILSQTVLKHSANALEVLLINDGSQDESLALLKLYQARHPLLFRVIEQPSNQGLGATRNLGLAEARGDYIGFVDSDDWIHAEHCEALLKAAQLDFADYAQCQMLLCEGERAIRLSPVSLAENTSVCNKLFSRRFLKKHQIHFAEGELFEDEIFSYLAHHYATETVSIKQALYHYRANPNGICRSAQGDVKRLYARKSALVNFLETLRQRELLKPLQYDCLEMVCRHALLQLQANVAWSDLVGFWGFCEHLIQRYQLMPAPELHTNSYFVAQFLKSSSQLWRLWLLRHYSQWSLRLAA